MPDCYGAVTPHCPTGAYTRLRRVHEVPIFWGSAPVGTHEVPEARLAAHRRKVSGMGKRSGSGCRCARQIRGVSARYARDAALGAAPAGFSDKN
jgi:hypothetical protein